MKKSLITAALVASMSLVAVACDNDEATPEPTTPAEAVESMAAEVEDAAASMAALAEDAVEDVVDEAEGAVEDAVDEAEDATE